MQAFEGWLRQSFLPAFLADVIRVMNSSMFQERTEEQQEEEGPLS